MVSIVGGLNLALSLLFVQLASSAPVNSEFKCEKDGVYGNPTDCLKFIICAQGQRQDFDCPQGMSWHADRGLCDATDLSKCPDRIAPGSSGAENSEDAFKQHLLSLLADFKPCHAGETTLAPGATTENPGQGGNGTTAGNGGGGETTPGNGGGSPATGPTTAGPGETTPGNPGNNGGSTTGNPGGNPGSSPNPDGGNTGTTPGNGGGSSTGNPGGNPTTPNPGQGGNGSTHNPGDGGSTPQPTTVPPPTCPACPIPTEKVCPAAPTCVVCPTTTVTPKKPTCDNGWTFNEATKSCYLVDQNPSGQSRTSQVDAQKACLKQEANLAAIHSAEENAFVLNLVNGASRPDMNYGAWIGLYRVGNGPNDFVNYDGTSVDYKNFAEGMVDNTGGNEFCVVLARAPESEYDGKWNDLPCSGLQVTYVCKKPANI